MCENIDFHAFAYFMNEYFVVTHVDIAKRNVKFIPGLGFGDRNHMKYHYYSIIVMH